MSTIASNEPAIATGTITGLVAATITLVVAFGLPITDEQTLAIVAFVTLAAPLVSGYITRRQVVPNGNVAVKVERNDDTGDVLVAGDGVDLTNGSEVEVYEVDPPQDEALPVD